MTTGFDAVSGGLIAMTINLWEVQEYKIRGAFHQDYGIWGYIGVPLFRETAMQKNASSLAEEGHAAALNPEP